MVYLLGIVTEFRPSPDLYPVTIEKEKGEKRNVI